MRSFRYRVPALVVIASLVLATGAGADIFLLDFAGYDWFGMGDIGEPGSCYWAVGFVNSVNPIYLTVDYGTNEYTFVISGLCHVSSDTVGMNIFHDYAGGGFDVYEDPLAGGTAADYGTSPPNATSPSTFQDGTLILGGDFAGNVTIWQSMADWSGSLSGYLNFDRGSQLGNIPVDQRDMALTIAGMTFMPPGGPEGYFWQIDGQVFIPEATPVEKTTWGRIKQLGGN